MPELVMSVSLIGIISISLLSAITYYFTYVTRNNAFIDMTTDSQNFLRSTAEELRYGAGVRQINSIADPNAPAGGWNTSNANFVIVIAMPATDSADNYIIDTATGDPYSNEYVYYRQGSTLYRRKLAHPAATGNTVKTTCPPASATPSCPADAALLLYIDSITFNLFDQDNGSTTNPLLARSVKVNLSMKRETFGQPLVLANSVQTTLRNNF